MGKVCETMVVHSEMANGLNFVPPSDRPTERTRPPDQTLRTAIPRLIIQYQMSYHSNYRLFLRI